MDLFKKNKMPSKKKVKKGNNLSKYLPTTLFIGVQEDVNEKALIGYITSLSQSAFSNLKEVKFSTKKLGKNRYIYEIHNGSNDLTYLPLVIANLIEGAEKEIVLKTQGQNVRVVKKTATKIESNSLISSNNREDDAQVDLETKGKMRNLVKEGTGFLIFSMVASSITGILASASFVSKYYMLNEDYSYNPKVPDIQTPYEYLKTLKAEEHTKYRYLENIKFKNGKWNTQFIELEKPKEEAELPPENIQPETVSNSVANMTDNQVNTNTEVVKPETIKNSTEVTDNTINNEIPAFDASSALKTKAETVEERRQRIEERRKQRDEERRKRKEQQRLKKEMTEKSIMEGSIEAEVVSNNIVVESQPVEPEIVNTEKSIKESPQTVENLPVETRIEPVEPIVVKEEEKVENKSISITEQEEEKEVVVDEFEIVEEVDIEGLDLSNLPDNVILEEGDK